MAAGLREVTDFGSDLADADDLSGEDGAEVYLGDAKGNAVDPDPETIDALPDVRPT